MSYRKDFQLSLGLVSVSVSLENVTPTSKSGMHRLCPTHHERLNQQYRCPGKGDEEAHNIEWGQWVMGGDTDKGYVIVDEGNKPDIESVNGLSLVPVPAKELEDNTIEGDALYYCKPSSEASLETWAVLRKVVGSGKLALVAKGALRKNSEKIWRVTVFRDYLVLREVLFPDRIADTPEAIDFKVPAATMKLVTQYVDSMMTTWAKMDTTDNRRQQLEAWLETGQLIDRPEAERPSATSGEQAVDLMTALAQAVEGS